MKTQLLHFRKYGNLKNFWKSPEAFMIFILLVVLLLEISSLLNVSAFGAIKNIDKQHTVCPPSIKIDRLRVTFSNPDERKNIFLPLI